MLTLQITILKLLSVLMESLQQFSHKTHVIKTIDYHANLLLQQIRLTLLSYSSPFGERVRAVLALIPS